MNYTLHPTCTPYTPHPNAHTLSQAIVQGERLHTPPGTPFPACYVRCIAGCMAMQVENPPLLWYKFKSVDAFVVQIKCRRCRGKKIKEDVLIWNECRPRSGPGYPPLLNPKDTFLEKDTIQATKSHQFSSDFTI